MEKYEEQEAPKPPKGECKEERGMINFGSRIERMNRIETLLTQFF